MRHAARWSVLPVLCLFGTAQAQPAECGGHVCISEAQAPAATGLDRSPTTATLANFAELERCSAALVELIAASEGERRLACSAVGHALQLVGRCRISLRRPLHAEIKSEVRHPLYGAIRGQTIGGHR
jgi:hypothetical protein